MSFQEELEKLIVNAALNGAYEDAGQRVLKGSVSEEPKNSNIKIAILQRGWVMIGRYSEDGDTCSCDSQIDPPKTTTLDDIEKQVDEYREKLITKSLHTRGQE